MLGLLLVGMVGVQVQTVWNYFNRPTVTSINVRPALPPPLHLSTSGRQVEEKSAGSVVFPDVILCPQPAFDVERALGLGLSVPALAHLVANTRPALLGQWKSDAALDAEIRDVLDRQHPPDPFGAGG